MKSNLLTRDTIAGAVAREIERREFVATKQIEGVAYKAAFDRKGSGADKHIEAFRRDNMVMYDFVKAPEFL